MIIGVCRVELHIPSAHSLKEKRHVVKSIVARLHNQFNVSAAEIEDQELWQRAVIGFAVVTNDGRHADEVLSSAIGFVASASHDAEMTDYATEIVPAL